MSVNTKVNGQLVKSAGLYSVTAPIGMADIYSTEEKEVGLWTNNKPLYQRTIIASGITMSQSSIADLATLSDIDELFIVSAYAIEGGATINYMLPEFGDRIMFNKSNGKLQTATPTGSTWSNATFTVTVQYTKTTDTPWSGKFVPQGYGYVSSGDIYSFEERQIGVFADGKPLYQKTVNLGSDVTISYNSWTSLTNSDIPISDIENLVSVIGIGSTGGSYGSLMAGVASGGTALNIQTGRNGNNVFVRYITLQYTKTTDVAGSGEYVPSGDKAEHYSTEEEVIGTWLGETLYRKTFNGLSLSVSANGTWVDTGINISNIDIITSCLCRGGVFVWNIINGFKNEGKLYLTTGVVAGSNTFGVSTITLEYTKSV